MTIWRLVATFFYLGKLPFAPGSWGSLGALIIWIFLPLSYSLQLMVITILFSIGIVSSKKISNDLNWKLKTSFENLGVRFLKPQKLEKSGYKSDETGKGACTRVYVRQTRSPRQPTIGRECKCKFMRVV